MVMVPNKFTFALLLGLTLSPLTTVVASGGNNVVNEVQQMLHSDKLGPEIHEKLLHLFTNPPQGGVKDWCKNHLKDVKKERLQKIAAAFEKFQDKHLHSDAGKADKKMIDGSLRGMKGFMASMKDFQMYAHE